MLQQWTRDQRKLEVTLILVICGISCLFYAMRAYRVVILNLYFLPVSLSGFYLGRYRAGMMAFLSASVVAVVAWLNVDSIAVPVAPFAAMLGIGVWGAALGLTSLLIGTLSDERLRKLNQLRQSHKSDSLVDALTGVANRRAFQYELTRRMSEWNRQRTPLALVLIDVDHFKKFNDTYGHQAGDAVLRDVAHAVRAAVREVDLVARYGGEEFAIVLPNTGLDEAKEAAERVRSIIEASRFEFAGFKLRLTVSVGLTHVSDGDDFASLVQRTDSALYASKQAGRNCAHYHNGTTCDHFGESLPCAPENEHHGDDGEATSDPEAYADSTTGLPSRRVFNEELRRRVSEAHRYDSQLSTMIIDVDRFAEINARGSPAGDMVLTAVAEFIIAALRDSDLVAKYGKNQFAVLLPATPLEDAAIPADRIRQRVYDYDLLTYQGERLSFSASIGLAELHRDEDAGSFLRRALEAAHVVSTEGGNRVYLHNGHMCVPVKGEAVA